MLYVQISFGHCKYGITWGVGTPSFFSLRTPSFLDPKASIYRTKWFVGHCLFFLYLHMRQVTK